MISTATTLSVKDWLPVPLMLVALRVTSNVPVTVGLPNSNPLVELRVSPSIPRPPISLNLGAGVPDAVSWKERKIPLTNVALSADVMFGVEIHAAELVDRVRTVWVPAGQLVGCVAPVVAT